MITFLNDGLLDLSFWGYVAITFVFAQISLMGVTLYLHRDQAHRSINLHPAIRHFFRGWLWLTTGMVTREWVAVHRKHHAMVEREGDPHSPLIFGLRKVLLEGAELYREEAAIEETLEKYGRGTPDDWVEHNVYRRFGVLGVWVVLLIDVVLLGLPGIIVFALQMLTIPVCAAGIINGVGHAKGYRNFETEDTSTNLSPLAILIAGEELHNNHHAFPTSAKFSVRWWEFDIGWFYIRVLQALGLCEVRRTLPMPQVEDRPRKVDIEMLTAVLQNKMHVLRDYRRKVIFPVLSMEKRAHRENKLLKRARGVLGVGPLVLDAEAKQRLARVLEENATLRTVHEYREQLLSLWEQANVSNERLLNDLKEWCARAEASGINALQDFSAHLRGYLPKPASFG
ncbi:MAG: fatty acid desaturase [Gammaproteobacteria bacterium]|nr:fatty acid desaturase [Gammaproteobacteria bacterium]